MDTILTAVNESLIDNLDFNLPTQASYVLENRKASYGPQSGNVYSSSSGARMMRFNLTSGGGWLDPKSVYINFDLNAVGNIGLMPEPYAYFQRIRLLSKGKVIEDVSDYNRVHYQLSLLYKDDTERKNENTMGCSGIQELDTYKHYINNLTDAELAVADAACPVLSNASVKKMCFRPALGLFQQSKFLPLSFTDLVMEIELVSSAADVLVPASSKKPFNKTTDFGADFEIKNPTVTANIALLDSGADNNYISLLLSGKSLNIPFVGHVSSFQTVTSNDFQINVSRNLTKLKKIICSYDRDIPGADAAFGRRVAMTRPYRALYAPRTNNDTMVTYPEKATEGSISKLQVQIGSHLFPENPVSSIAEAYKYTKECSDSMSIDNWGFYNEQFIFALNLEKAKGGKFDGLNVKNNQIIVFSKTISTPHRCHVVLEHDSILEINDTSVSVYD